MPICYPIALPLHLITPSLSHTISSNHSGSYNQVIALLLSTASSFIQQKKKKTKPTKEIEGKVMAGEEESSSGCQSGWTVYFDQSYIAPPPLSSHYSKDINRFESPREEESESESESDEEEEEEDLSMISDASSGPPHFDTEEQHSECGTLLKKRKVDRLSDTKRDHCCSSLDDTASSPMLNNHSISYGAVTTDIETTAESAPEFSCAFSGTYIKEESVLRKKTGYLQPIANLKLPTMTTTSTLGYPNKKIKRRNGDAFPSWSSQEQSMQEFL